MGEQLPNISYDGVSLQKIHTWLQLGDGGASAREAVDGLHQMVEILGKSQDRLVRVLRALGAEWEGDAGGQAGDSTARMAAWQAEAEPIVAANAQAVGDFLGSWLETRSSLPSPAEAELTDHEQALAAAIPGLGPVVSKQLAEDRLVKVTKEAQDGMHRWHQQATATVARVEPLPSVPTPVIQIEDPATGRSIIIDDPGGTDQAGVRPSVPVAPPPPGTPPGSPGSPTPPAQPPQPTPPAVPVHPPGTPGSPGGHRPVLPVHPPQPPGGHHPAPAAPGQPNIPTVVPPAPGGPGSGTGTGSRRGYGPGLFPSEQRNPATPRQPAQPGLPGHSGRGGPLSATPGGQAPGGQAPGGRGGVMQPAVGAGAGARRDEDKEHKNKYADRDDEPFASGIPKVAPPVIGAPDHNDRRR